MPDASLLPSITGDLATIVSRNRADDWPDIPVKTKRFLIEYAKDGNFNRARKKAKIGPTDATQILKNRLCVAYLDEFLATDRETALITRDFIQLQLLETLEQVNGDVDVPTVVQGIPMDVRQFDARAKIAVLKELAPFAQNGGQDRRSTASLFERARTRKTYDSADQLWAAVAEYIEWLEANPVYRDGEPQMRIPTTGTLCVFIGVSPTAWGEWAGHEEFGPVVESVNQMIDDAKLAAAAAGLVNPTIIAKDLGLVDRLDHSSSDGSLTPPPAVDFSKLSTGALAELHAALNKDDAE